MSLRRISHWLQFDKSLSFALIARIWQACSGPITIALLIRELSLQEQGVFYGVQNIVAVQPLFELGLASVLISQAGNLTGRAASGSANSSEPGRAQLAWLAQASLRWFTAVAVLYFVAGIVLGWKVLDGSGTAVSDWRLPLILTLGLSAVSLAVSPRIYVLEGAGQREFVYRMRLLQAIVGSFVIWLALLLDLKLWAIVVVFGVATFFHLGMAFGSRARHTLSWPGNRPGGQPVSWLRKIGPLQWRMAAISAAHYLASQMLYLYVLNYHNAAQAAPLGMTLQVTAAIQALALAWAQTKFPLISRYQAEAQREFAGTLWRQTALVSSGLLVLAVASLAVSVWGLGWFGRGWESRFIPPWLIWVLGIGYLANHWLALQSFYVLSRGGKPLVAASLTGLLGTALAVWLGGREYSVIGVACAYSLAMAGVTLPLHSWAYLRLRAGWR